MDTAESEIFEELPLALETGANCLNPGLFIAGLEVGATGSFVERGDGFSGGGGTGATVIVDFPGGACGMNGSGGIIALSTTRGVLCFAVVTVGVTFDSVRGFGSCIG